MPGAAETAGQPLNPFLICPSQSEETGKVSIVASGDFVTQFWPLSLQQKIVRDFRRSVCLFLMKGTETAGVDSSIFFLP